MEPGIEWAKFSPSSRKRMSTTNILIYQERVSSKKTGLIFASLTILFFILLVWRFYEGKKDILSAIFFFLFVFFLFYTVNYRTLVISLTPEFLRLRFGVFKWEVPMENVDECRLDELPLIKKYGGAGIHFMFERKRYRASFNFL
jgi:hypothetical protein